MSLDERAIDSAARVLMAVAGRPEAYVAEVWEGSTTEYEREAWRVAARATVNAYHAVANEGASH